MLSSLRKIIDKYHFPPDLIGKAECMACDIYDMINKATRTKKPVKECRDATPEEFSLRQDRLRSLLSIKIRDAKVGESIFIKASDYGGTSVFIAYAHNVCKIHSRISIKSVNNDGWIVTKIKDKTI